MKMTTKNNYVTPGVCSLQIMIYYGAHPLESWLLLQLRLYTASRNTDINIIESLVDRHRIKPDGRGLVLVIDLLCPDLI